MASIFLTVACIGLILYRIYRYMFDKPENFPPGPPRLPLLGSYPFMLLLNYKHMHKAIDWLCKYYKTDVLGCYAADYPTIVANTTATTKELLRNPDLDGKPVLLLARLRDPEFITRGIFFSEGPFWHEQRRFLLRYLRDFGFGRRFDELELEISDEIGKFIGFLKNGVQYDYEKKFTRDGCVLVPKVFSPTFGNMFLKVLINERWPREKLDLLSKASDLVYTFLSKSDDWGRMFSFIEWLAKIFPNWSDYNILREASIQLYNCIKEIVDEQHKSFDPNHERHFLDMYFKKMNATKNEAESSFYYKQLVMICTDVFVPALNANALQLQFLLQRLCFQPEILKKCQEEIDNVVGQGRLPSLNDRTNLPYVEATLRESLRHDTLVPSGLPHRALNDTKFMGYNVPKGTIVFGILDSAHLDEDAWTEPKLFKPERFLDKNGKLSLKLDKSLPFGAGKRLCAGETFARNTMFLMVTALLQNFNIKVPVGGRIPNESETHTGMAQMVPEFWLRFEPR